MKVSITEENYLKAIYKISERNNNLATTSAISGELKTTAASVTDMLKKLSDKSLINYQKYRGVSLTKTGSMLATALIRKHRLWEVFLVNKLNFAWDEVHDIAEELEHIDSEALIERLDAFLEYPKYDPHGDPIPNKDGKIMLRRQLPLSHFKAGESGILVGVQEHTSSFLQHLDSLNIALGVEIEVEKIFDFDDSVEVRINRDGPTRISPKVCQNLLMKKN